MSRKELGYLLQQYLEGKCTDEEKLFVEHWYGTLQNDTKQPVSELEFQELEPMLWQQIQNRTLSAGVVPMPVPASSRRIGFRQIAIAASVVLALTLSWWFLRPPSSPIARVSPQEIGHPDWIQHINTSRQTETVRLSDGSTVRLAPGSAVTYPTGFAPGKREIYLAGEAFFDVTKQPDRPFYVYSGPVITRVLGTSFRIKSQDQTDNVVVEVVTGRVSVYQSTGQSTRGQAGKIILRPNQKATYITDKQQFDINVSDHPQLIAEEATIPVRPSFNYDDVPLGEVVTQLEAAYGISIRLDNPKQKDCPLTADLGGLGLYAQLDMICAATKSSYVTEGTTIVISGKGCANI